MSSTHPHPHSMPKRGRLPFEHHSGNYRMVDPTQPGNLSKPWEWTPVTTYELPMSPIKPIFAIPSLSDHTHDPLVQLARSRTHHARSPVQLQLNTNPNMTAIGGASFGGSSLSSPTSSMGKKSMLGSSATAATAGTALVMLPNSKKERLWSRIIRFLTMGYSTRSHEIVLPPPLPLSDSLQDDKVKPHEWKQYGYWAKPHLNGVYVDNASPLPPKPISTADLQILINSLHTDNAWHPEKWIAGTTHPSLPTKPTRWKPPVPGAPFPFPWEVQLNPLLKHHLWGESPLKWYIARDPKETDYALAHGGSRANTPCQPPDLAQPATYPFLTHMHINAVAGDTAPSFPWPFTVTNEHGITVGDVLRGVFKAFTMPILLDEKNSWPVGRQRAAHNAWSARFGMLKKEFEEWGFDLPNELKPMLRCDAMGGVMWFRGIEPSVNGGGWMITLGTH